MSRRRAFGRVRRLPSGRFQARYLTPGGQERRAPCTFATEREAELFLAGVETDLRRGTWFDATAGDIRLDVYAPRWIVERPVELQPRTLEIYESLLRNHIYPEFGRLHLSRITSAAVRTWHASLRERGIGQVTVAKAYRLLKAICATAVEDELIAKNPCRLRNAGVERTRERKPPSLEEVERIAEAIEPRYRTMVILAAWSGLRWGELAALSRQRIDRLHGTVHVEESMIQLSGGRRFIGPPKSAAGRRTVAIPPHLWPAIDGHLATYVGPTADALVFTKASGVSLDRANFYAVWRRATRRAGVGDYRFHDLRHLAATLAAVSGATTRELMHRIGHSSFRAALIYQHATEDRDHAIAEAMSRLVEPTPLSPRPRAVDADG
ncbi:MAG TPA: tyrosine-type recombinase/integrase [Mycobacteriales bacterium]|nr:tyrosine-type recombinase/integrase [Mycobacteriales bacterium]